MEVVTIFEFLAHCGDVDDFFLWFGEVRSTENTIEGVHGKSFASVACKLRQLPYLHPGGPLLLVPPSWFIGPLCSLCQILTKDLTNKMLMHVKKNYLIGFVFEHSFQKYNVW